MWKNTIESLHSGQHASCCFGSSGFGSGNTKATTFHSKTMKFRRTKITRNENNGGVFEIKQSQNGNQELFVHSIYPRKQLFFFLNFNYKNITLHARKDIFCKQEQISNRKRTYFTHMFLFFFLV